MKDFINDFYSYDFTGIIHNDESSDESDFEIDLDIESKVMEDDETNKESLKENNETVTKILQQETACIIIDN